MHDLFSILNNLKTYTEVKILFTVFFSLSQFLFGSVYNEMLIAVFALLVLDTITGLIASYGEGEPITSKRFVSKVKQGTVYFVAISAGYFADLTLPINLIQYGMISFVSLTEFVSITENFGRMGYKMPQRLLNQIRNKRDGK